MNIEEKEIRGISLRLVIVVGLGLISITSSVVWGIGRIERRIEEIGFNFESQADSIRRYQEYRSIKNDYEFKEIRKDIEVIKDKFK